MRMALSEQAVWVFMQVPQICILKNESDQQANRNTLLVFKIFSSVFSRLEPCKTPPPDTKHFSIPNASSARSDSACKTYFFLHATFQGFFTSHISLPHMYFNTSIKYVYAYTQI